MNKQKRIKEVMKSLNEDWCIDRQEMTKYILEKHLQDYELVEKKEDDSDYEGWVPQSCLDSWS